MKSFLVLGIGSVVFMLSGCLTTGGNMNGAVFVDNKSAVAVNNNVGTSKIGRACTTGILGFVSGDSSIETAKSNGSIKTVATVDLETTNVLGIYGKSCTVIRGE